MRKVVNDVLNEYQIPLSDYERITSKTTRVYCNNGKCFILKESDINANEKYKFLSYQHINNVLYPIKNENGNYISRYNNKTYTLLPFEEDNKLIDELKIHKLESELSMLHMNTYYKKELSPITSRKKFEEIYEYLKYKFNLIEAFVRTVEVGIYDEYSILILKNYHYILDSRKVMEKLNKKLIEDVKSKKSVNYSFVHNNPKLNHLIISDYQNYLISIDRSKIGIPSLDMVKFYIETEDINIDRKEIINEYFSRYNDSFYFDYFCFFVMLYYIKSIIIMEKDFVSSQSFVYSSQSLKNFMEMFNLNDK